MNYSKYKMNIGGNIKKILFRLEFFFFELNLKSGRVVLEPLVLIATQIPINVKGKVNPIILDTFNLFTNTAYLKNIKFDLFKYFI